MRVWNKTHRNYIILPLAPDANGGMTDPARLSPPQAGFSGRISLRRRPAAASPGACLQKAFGPCFSAEHAGKAGKKACRQNLYHAFRRAGCPLRTRPHDAMISRAPAKEHRKRTAETRISTDAQLRKERSLEHFLQHSESAYLRTGFSDSISAWCKMHHAVPEQRIRRVNPDKSFGYQLFSGKRKPFRDAICSWLSPWARTWSRPGKCGRSPGRACSILGSSGIRSSSIVCMITSVWWIRKSFRQTLTCRPWEEETSERTETYCGRHPVRFFLRKAVIPGIISASMARWNAWPATAAGTSFWCTERKRVQSLCPNAMTGLSYPFRSVPDC